MCFYNDYDWTASLTRTSDGPADSENRCDECGNKIAAGEWRKSVYMQQHESCQICEDEWSEYYIDADEMRAAGETEVLQDLANHKCDYGEACDYVRCEACDKVLRSIEAHEKAAGCPSHSRQPSLYGLWEELHEHDDAPTYIAEAVTAYPELWNHRPVFRMLDYYTEA